MQTHTLLCSASMNTKAYIACLWSMIRGMSGSPVTQLLSIPNSVKKPENVICPKSVLGTRERGKVKKWASALRGKKSNLSLNREQQNRAHYFFCFMDRHRCHLESCWWQVKHVLPKLRKDEECVGTSQNSRKFGKKQISNEQKDSEAGSRDNKRICTS